MEGDGFQKQKLVVTICDTEPGGLWTGVVIFLVRTWKAGHLCHREYLGKLVS